MLQQPQADDFVIGTGVSRSVREMCETAYAVVGLDWREHVVTDPRFVRPAETSAAVADASKAQAAARLGADHQLQGHAGRHGRGALERLQPALSAAWDAAR